MEPPPPYQEPPPQYREPLPPFDKLMISSSPGGIIAQVGDKMHTEWNRGLDLRLNFGPLTTTDANSVLFYVMICSGIANDTIAFKYHSPVIKCFYSACIS